MTSLGVDLVELTKERKVGFFLQHFAVDNMSARAFDLSTLHFKSRVTNYTHADRSGTRVRVTFELLDGTDNTIASGYSHYATVNTETGKPMQCPPDIWEKFTADQELTSTTTSHLFEKPQVEVASANVITTKDLTVGKEHIDFYGHVSSESYCGFIESTLQQSALEMSSFKLWEIYFLGSLTSVGQTFQVQISKNDSTQKHIVATLVKTESTAPLIVAKFG